jgi:hypothetical protein
VQAVPRSRILWLVVLITFWAFYGLTGRDAWKAEEALALAPVLDWLHHPGAVLSLPAPLYTVVAGLASQLSRLSGLGLDVQDAARLASGLFTLISVLFTGLAARALYGPGFGPAAALGLVGGFGLMLRAHALLPETALLAAWAVLIYGMAIGHGHPSRGGIWMGLALTALTLGLRGFPDLVLGLVLVCLPLAFRPWRSPEYRQALVLACGLAAGLVLAGLALLHLNGRLPAWLAEHGPQRLLSLAAPSRAYSELAWFAWPLWPLAAWALWHAHRRLARAPELYLPLVALLVLAIAALLPAWSRDGALLPLLLPLALLAAFAVNDMGRGAAQAFYWFGVLCFLFFIVAFWTYFAAMEWGFPAKLASHVAQLTPSYRIGSVPRQAVLLAAGATLLWLVAIPLFPRASIRPILVWATGMILTWVLIITLFRPWAEAGWAYRPVIADLARHLPAGACLNTRVDPAMEVMLRLHLKARPKPGCAWTLSLETAPGEGAANGKSRTVWEGYRPRYKNLVYRLERRG